MVLTHNRESGSDRASGLRLSTFISTVHSELFQPARLIETVPELVIDYNKSVRVVFKHNQDGPDLELHCEADTGPENYVYSIRLVGLRLKFNREIPEIRDEDLDPLIGPYYAAMVKLFHSQVPAFPHLRVVELHANPRVLRRAAASLPEITESPFDGGQVIYHWGCPHHNFQYIPEEYASYTCLGVNPKTLEFSGMSVTVKFSV